MTNYIFTPIAEVRSPYKDKFAVPRQPGLASSITSEIVVFPPYHSAEHFDQLQAFSHIWIQFIFHQTADKAYKPKVRPPRLGGNKSVGVFASRSTFRPNPIGLSVCELKSISFDKKHTILTVSGLDLIDKTPILDIKPYIQYSDSITNGISGYAQQEPTHRLEIIFSNASLKVLESHSLGKKYQQNIVEIISLDPRPSYKLAKADDKQYFVKLYDFEVCFSVNNNQAIIESIIPTQG